MLIAALMEDSGVKFGTSGARGLAADMTDRVCYAYTLAFLRFLEERGAIDGTKTVALAGDLRPSTPRIMAAVGMAVHDAGYRVANCAFIPTPAVALFGLARGIPAIMVTGSHIPDDRNGIKFYKPDGELLKDDEQAMTSRGVSLPEGRFDATGGTISPFSLPAAEDTAEREYVRRYLDFFPAGCLAGSRIGVYQHSGVSRDLMAEILRGLGAEVVCLGRSARFIPVDTEAIRAEDVELAKGWSLEYGFDAIISADGDGDRPLLSDADGNWLRGDVAGILTARYLQAGCVVTPVSSNSAVEQCGWFSHVRRTRIGSPYVIEAMQQAQHEGMAGVVGYEANGGFLTAGDIVLRGRTLAALPTRDALIVPLAILQLAGAAGTSVAGLLAMLPQRFTASDRLKDFPSELSQAHLVPLQAGDALANIRAAEALLGSLFGRVEKVDTTDGIRIGFASGEVVHLRPSGNAPELRCYTEAASEARAVEMNRICLTLLESWRA
jgi:phosphomannomutase